MDVKSNGANRGRYRFDFKLYCLMYSRSSRPEGAYFRWDLDGECWYSDYDDEVVRSMEEVMT